MTKENDAMMFSPSIGVEEAWETYCKVKRTPLKLPILRFSPHPEPVDEAREEDNRFALSVSTYFELVCESHGVVIDYNDEEARRAASTLYRQVWEWIQESDRK